MLSGVRIGAHRIPASTKGDSSRMRAMTWPALLSALAVFLIASLVTPTVGQDKSGTLRFGVGPLQPTPTETKKAYEPFFAYLAKQLNRDFDLVATTDWAGISVALANRQVDLAWMGPWGYILAHDDSDVRAIATAKYDGEPIYHAMIESGKIDRRATEVIWQSDPLPNDAIAVPKDFDPGLAERIQRILVAITDAQAKTILPTHYTGFVAADHGSYKMIEDAGVLVGRIKKK